MTESYKDKAVLITGATSGIGRALALELARRGARLFLTGRDASRLAEAVAACKEHGAPFAAGTMASLEKPDECARMVGEATRALGGLDVLVNNAGVTMWADFRATKDPAWINRIMEVNFNSVAHCTYHALPHLVAARGRLVAVSSIAGLVGVPGHAVYGASKHAINGFMNALRVELAGTGVTVTVVAPDFVVTGIHERGINAEGQAMGKKLDPSRHLSADACARLVADGIAARKRLVMTSTRGKLAAALRDLVPPILDRIVARQSRKASLH